MISIYNISNKINNKCYIGFSKNPENRFKAHIRMLNKNKHHSYKLQEDFNKYGKDVFEFEIVESNIPDKFTEIKEVEYIKLYKSYEIGYNCTKGGNINKTGQKYWEGQFGKDHNAAKKVYQYTKDGVFIREWGSIIDAARSFGVENSHLISKCCKGVTYSAYKYYWTYEYKGENIKVPKIKYYQERAVIMIDPITNKKVKEFPSAKEAEVFLNKENNKICVVCKGERQHWAGYKWKYKT